MFLFSAKFSKESQMSKVNYIFSNVISTWLSQIGRFIHPTRQKEMCILVTLLIIMTTYLKRSHSREGQAYLASVSELRWSIRKGRYGPGWFHDTEPLTVTATLLCTKGRDTL